MERELLLRAAKSRSKNEDPEQAKLKAKAKEVHIDIKMVSFFRITNWQLFFLNI